MSKTVLILLIVVKIVCMEKIFYNLDDAEVLFDKFIHDYDRTYTSEKEYNDRFEIFKENLRSINELNSHNPLTTFGINHFADRTHDEIVRKPTKQKLSLRIGGPEVRTYAPTGKPTKKLDYRKLGLVTSVKDQLDCGSCYIFGAIGNIEGQYAKKYGKLVSLSTQQALDCGATAECEGGEAIDVMIAIAQQGGVMLDEDYAYEGKKNEECCLDDERIVANVTGAYELRVSREKHLMNALAEIGPLSVGINSDALERYESGILFGSCDEEIDHEVLLIGYGKENGVRYWIIKNSWSEDWGENGYARLMMGRNVCHITEDISTAIVA